jgi:hypothetical protein
MDSRAHMISGMSEEYAAINRAPPPQVSKGPIWKNSTSILKSLSCEPNMHAAVQHTELTLEQTTSTDF